MIKKSEKSIELYKLLQKRGYPEDFCDAITQNLNTDFTATRMIGYLSHYKDLPAEEIVDEMLAILEHRAAIMQKMDMERTQEAWNNMMASGFMDDADDM